MIRSDILFRFAVVAVLVGIGAWLRSEPQTPPVTAEVTPQSAVARTLQGETVGATLKAPATVGGGLGNRHVNEFLVKQGSGPAPAKTAP